MYRVYNAGWQGMDAEDIGRIIPNGEYDNYEDAIAEFNRTVEEDAASDEAVYLFKDRELIEVWNG